MPQITPLVLLLLVAGASSHDESRIVRTTQGRVRGYKTGGIFHFYGIPYAMAPTGRRRFSAPLPGPVWMNPLEAVNNKIICPQGKTAWFDLSKHDMREDCLIVNVHVPDTNETNLPVVVYVHGGAYQLGYGEVHPPTPLVLTKKVIGVTFNYRLGVHGFLCLGTENAPGNAGMKDQVALLRWVKDNIANFGGNPHEVTIAGYSAGSSAVDLLMISDITEGLFNKVIPESGASLGVWSVQIDPVQNAKDFAKELNFTEVDDLNSLDEFYSSLSFDAMTSNTIGRPDSSLLFSPCIERETGIEKFLNDTPVNILRKGKYRKVPVLYGFANMDGLFRAPQFEQWKERMNDRFSDFLPADLQFKDDEEKERIAKMIKEFYFGNETVSEENIQGFIDYFSDILFAYSHLRSVKLHVEAGSNSIYLYEYSFYRPYAENVRIPEFLKNLRGAGHCAQSFVVLESSNENIDYGPDSDEYIIMKKIMVNIWVSFITTGNPVPIGSDLPAWPPVGANRSPHMELGAEIQIRGPLLEKRALFWDHIYELHYRSPVAPSLAKFTDEL